MWIKSVRNSGPADDQLISGTEEVDVRELSLPFSIRDRSQVYVHAILTVAPEVVAKDEKLVANIQVTSSDAASEPQPYGPYGFRSGDLQAQHSFVVDTDIELEPGDYTAKVTASVSGTGSGTYRLRAQGSCRMTLIAVPAE